MDNRPIGIMDSGVGGLTVARILKEKYPKESIVFIGDTANNPYGERTPENITELAENLKNFLIEKNVKMIIIACNTITFNVPKSFYDEKIPIVGMSLEFPKFENAKDITVFATPATINLHVHKNSLNKNNSNLKIQEIACEGLAHAIEENISKNEIKNMLISIINKTKFKDTDIGVYACTHYPLIQDIFKEIWEKTLFWDPAENTIENAIKILNKKNIRAEKFIKNEFYFTKDANRAETVISRFFGKDVFVKNINLGC